jgi:hypothetical protein
MSEEVTNKLPTSQALAKLVISVINIHMDTNVIGKIPNNISISETRIKYCLYARKSTESDEQQALSIDSQIKEMTAIAERLQLNVVVQKMGSVNRPPP